MSFEDGQAELHDFYAEGLAEQQKLEEENFLLQQEAKRLIRLPSLQAKLHPFKDHGQRTEAELIVKYHQSLSDIDQCRVDLDTLQSGIDQDTVVLRTNLEKLESEATELTTAFTALRCASFGHLERSHGVMLTQAEAEGLEDKFQALVKEHDALRLQCITQKEKIAALTSKIKRTNEFGDRMKRIDFEQIKIENQTLAEKIEERSEELLKLRRRTVSTLQILAHIREKRHFITAQVQMMKRDLLNLDEQLGKLRDRLSQLKNARTHVRKQADDSRDMTGLSGNPILLADYKQREQSVSQLHEDVARIKERYDELTSKVQSLEKTKRKIQKALLNH